MNRPPITRDFAERFAEEWVAAWNAHDLVRILAHYEDDGRDRRDWTGGPSCRPLRLNAVAMLEAIHATTTFVKNPRPPTNYTGIIVLRFTRQDKLPVGTQPRRRRNEPGLAFLRILASGSSYSQVERLPEWLQCSRVHQGLSGHRLEAEGSRSI
jgi:hypothetical protein